MCFGGGLMQPLCKERIAALIKLIEIREALDLEFLVRKGVVVNLSEEKKERIMMILKKFKQGILI
jgi:hypothetical protein